MGQIKKAISHKDNTQDHIHTDTGPMIMKPNGLHSHLYELEGKTLETSNDSNDMYHVHSTQKGKTSGPKPIPDRNPAPKGKEFSAKAQLKTPANIPNKR